MTELVVPKLNNNDTSYTVVEWLFEDGEQVRAGDAVAVVETSKAAADLESEHDGVLHRMMPLMAECKFGDVLARVFPTEAERQEFLAAQQTAQTPAGDAPADVVITKSARELAEQLGIDLDRLRALGKRVVKQSDVEQLAPEDGLVELSRQQRAVAAVVSESHATVPAALAVVKVHADPALRHARRLGKQAGSLIGLPELLVKAVAARRGEFPVFFASRVDDRSVRLAEQVNVGVTVDVGTGLFVPVVRDVEALSPAEIAGRLMDFRERALEEGFSAQDLAGGNVMVSLHTDADIVLASPIVFPGQTCVVCLAGTSHELVLDETGEVAARRVVNVSLVYDHRVVNGREAVAFLHALKAELEGC
ncbi:MAG: 2-oxo acid dehydrogenase subunit E2 [Umezawaea sp.]